MCILGVTVSPDCILPSFFRYQATDYCDLTLCINRKSLSDQGCVWEDSISPGTKFHVEFKPAPQMAHTCPSTAQIHLCSWTNLGETPISSALNWRGLQKTKEERKLLQRGDSQIQNHYLEKSSEGQTWDSQYEIIKDVGSAKPRKKIKASGGIPKKKAS